MTNLFLHRCLVALAGVLILWSMTMTYWYAMFEIHSLAMRGVLCQLASLWWGLRMLRHCDHYEGVLR